MKAQRRRAFRSAGRGPCLDRRKTGQLGAIPIKTSPASCVGMVWSSHRAGATPEVSEAASCAVSDRREVRPPVRGSCAEEERAKMSRVLTIIAAAALLGCSPAAAQVGGIGAPPLGLTSPLGIGPGSPVSPTGIPMGATELSSPGVSPMTSGASPLVPSLGGATGCSTMAGSSQQPFLGTAVPSAGISGTVGSSSGSSAVFDGGGMAGSASGTCAGLATNPTAGPAASASSPTGMGQPSSVARVGIPLGSTELGVGGLSPPPDVLTSNPSAPFSTLGGSTPCPSGSMPSGIGTSTTGGVSTFSGSC
jgi:hypothetical protein